MPAWVASLGCQPGLPAKWAGERSEMTVDWPLLMLGVIILR